MYKLILKLKLLLLISLEINACFYNPFDGLNHTNSLEFSGVIFTHLPRRFVSSESAEYIILRNNGIRSIAEYAFAGLPNMKTLDLSNNNLLPKNFFSFGYHYNVEAIIFDNNFNKSATPQDLEIHISDSSSHLKYLSLRNVGLKVITADLRRYLYNLHYLDLSDNNINHVSVFPLLPNYLKSLCIENTGLRNISVSSQKYLTDLRNISISYNNVTNVSFTQNSNCVKSVCLHAPNIETLVASNCNISTFEIEEKLTMKRLDLSYNNISVLKNSSMRYLSVLRNFNISHNPLSYMIDMSLLTNLDVLTMDSVDRDMVTTFLYSNYKSNVKNLSLASNFIRDVPLTLLKNFGYLVDLNLSDNFIRSLDLREAANYFSLRSVDLSRNLLSDFQDIKVSNHYNLKLLDVSTNSLRGFQQTALSGIPRTTYVLYFNWRL